MTDRQRAQEVLRQAREILAERLTELVLAQGEEILADARGESYMNEIESLYEQVGMKLAHLGQIISHLPAEPIEPVATTAAAHHTPDETFSLATEPTPSADAVTEDTLPAIEGPVYVAAPALPPPGGAPSSRARATQLSLQAFAAQIQTGDLLSAGRTLGALFELDEPRAVACAATFAQRVRSDAGFFRRVMQLRSQVQAGDEQRVRALLGDCFGFSRLEAQEVLTVLRRRLRLED
ncbi:MAG: hypothetical protein L0211_10275 [Planctomycetaceae bacterium]|nr:hypothetical protein [Planctomycetaceae bacterium]